MKRAPTDLSGDHIVFEDVFKLRREVPLAYFASVHILQGFLNTHYQNTSAEGLVESSQYMLFSGCHVYISVFDIDQLCSGQQIHCGFLMMAIRYRAVAARCLDCMNKLEKQFGGGYCW